MEITASLRISALVCALAVALAWSSSAAAQYDRAQYCEAEAERAARDSGTVMGGSARGAARGAVLGSIVGGRKSARRGATLGAVTGGIRRAERKNDAYNYTYDSCMYGR